ncbi:MAG: hypothetical protein NVSMB6_04260 [Burkholderiaceae bacterium]
MNDILSNDEYEALGQLAAGVGGRRPSACVARNTKRLAGLRSVAYASNGMLCVTEKGRQTLFLRRCIEGLRAIAQDPTASLAADVKLFLAKKGHLITHAGDNALELTPRGRESLADIDQSVR